MFNGGKTYSLTNSFSSQEVVNFQPGHIKLTTDNSLDELLQTVITDSFLSTTFTDAVDKYGQNQDIFSSFSNLSISDEKVRQEIEKHSKCDKEDDYGNTLYHWLGITGRIGLVKVLDKRQLSVEKRNKFGLLPIHMAVLSNQLEALVALRPYYFTGGRAAEDTTLVTYQSLSGRYYEIALDTFQLAVFLGRESIVTWYLKTDNACFNINKFGNILHLAVANGQTTMFQLLLCHPKVASLLTSMLETPHQIDTDCSTVLDYAAALDRSTITQMILKAYRINNQLKNKPRLDQDKYALEVAIKYAAQSCTQIFLDMNTDITTLGAVMIDGKSSTFQDLAKNYYETDRSNQKREGIHVNIRKKGRTDIATKHQITPVNQKDVANIIFQGGGIKGLAHVGAYRAFCQILPKVSEDANAIGAIERVAGTSAGAIFATAVALGFTPDQLQNLLEDAPFDRFLDDIKPAVLTNKGLWGKLQGVFSGIFSVGSGVFTFATNPLLYSKNLLQREGFSSGDVITAWLSKILAQHLLKICQGQPTHPIADIINSIPHLRDSALIDLDAVIHSGLQEKQILKLTFGQLANLVAHDNSRFKHLYTVALKLNSEGAFNGKAGIETINSRDEMWLNVLVIDGIRASMSIPLVFTPHQLRVCNSDGSLVLHTNAKYVDGGVLKNYPIEIFDKFKFFPSFSSGDADKPEPNPFTIGFHLFSPPQKDNHKTGGIFTQLAHKWKEITSNIINTIDRSTAIGFLKNFMSLYYHAEDLIAEFQNTWAGRTINISDNGVDVLNFSLTPEEREGLLASGEQAVCEAYHQSYEEYLVSQTTLSRDNVSAAALSVGSFSSTLSLNSHRAQPEIEQAGTFNAKLSPR